MTLSLACRLLCFLKGGRRERRRRAPGSRSTHGKVLPLTGTHPRLQSNKWSRTTCWW